MVDKAKEPIFVSKFLVSNALMLCIGILGLSGLDRYVFSIFINESIYDGAYVLKKWLQVHTMVEVVCVIVIWLMYILFSLRWNSDKQTIPLLATIVHAVIWTLIYLLNHFAGGAGLLS